MPDTKAMTLRLPAELADDLHTVAAVDGQPISEVVRVAIAVFLRKRKADPEFQLAVVAWISRLERLANPPTAGDRPDLDRTQPDQPPPGRPPDPTRQQPHRPTLTALKEIR
ncbi:hypothetical protein [Actinocrispum wychmicini]|uniref:Ribbon-helix-helix CopG family protein n=1 Tax=Actinocrispum wychmicini TaxID=1213861 RepID=A0A4R2JC89_9PSEU|nr:hypothetical protein [Actinocrispum wychmicini]TCO57161.1 hypothetical protein EV192_106638 [Actinocrispum wychmicini]